MAENSSKQPKWLTEGVVIAALPVLGYYSAYHYEVGYLSYYGITPVFANVNFEIFFESLKVLIGGFWSMLLLVNLVLILWPEEKRNNIRLFIPLFVMLVFASLPIFFWTSFALLLIVTGIVTVFIFIEYVTPFWGRDGRSYIENLRLSHAAETKMAGRGLFGKMADWLGRWHLLAVLGTFIVVPGLAMIAGTHAATIQKNFLVTIYEGNEYLIVRRVGDSAILVLASDVNSKSKGKKFLYMKLNDSNPTKFRTYTKKEKQ